MAQLKPHNLVFKDELIAIKEACTWASQSNQPINIWTDDECSLRYIASLKTNNPLAQHIQNILPHSQNIKLGWIKVHEGHVGNEAEDLLAKKPTVEGIPTQYTAPGASSGEEKLLTISLQLCRINGTTAKLELMATSSFQRSSLPQLHGKAQNSYFEQVMTHFHLTLRYLASEKIIAVVVTSSEAFCTLQPAAPMKAPLIYKTLKHLRTTLVKESPHQPIIKN
ncbi:hypothetical protein AVEN_248496-1 [Araneus ventricosus]|uniref:RNase H type-1 domain-containing protein n=1 Tax=Araneus ventricosus TaxID=182803 RepID=A0A4Y2E038_ARAVE|nr:hypothetical protein AVEN_248496-1 [Araneus ventricosus]